MKVRKVEIVNFRSIQRFSWCPADGLNCLIGPGDSGKSTILDAIDWCLGARRTVQVTDADFYNLDVDSTISIILTLGDLDDALKNIDAYGLFLRGLNPETGNVEDEPERGLETVLTLTLTIESDLEPVWSLYSERAEAQNAVRNLAWKDRARLAPSRIGAFASYNLGWRHGSVLNKLTEERPDSSSALAGAARQARNAFGAEAEDQLEETLRLVTEAAGELGVGIGEKARALLDAHSVNFSGGSISLHNEDGVPLRGLGVGSTRLLIAGLQRKATERSQILLVDEIEYGLEPHRIIRFLGSLGAKDAEPPFQVFMTTHSPVVLRELSGSQLYVVRTSEGRHEALLVGLDDDVQGTIRSQPDAFLATSILVCEGASEVGLVKGLDYFRQQSGLPSVFACGVSLVDAGGVKKILPRALSLQKLGYRICVFRDDDVQPPVEEEASFIEHGGVVVKWQEGKKLENALFEWLPDEAVALLVDMACNSHGEDLIDEQLRSESGGDMNLGSIPKIDDVEVIDEETRTVLSVVSSGKRNPWFKSVTAMEAVGRDIVGPCLDDADEGLSSVLAELMEWGSDVR